MFAVQGTYNNGVVTIEEHVPIFKKYDVVVTFIKPLEFDKKEVEQEKKMDALNRITGILSDNSMTLEEARQERLNRQ